MADYRAIRVAVRLAQFTEQLAAAADASERAACAYARESAATADALRAAAAAHTRAASAARNLADAVESLDADQHRPATVCATTAEA